MEQAEIIPRSHQVAALLEGSGTHFERGQTFQIVAKLPIQLVATIDAFAKKSDKSRTQIISILLSLAVDEVLPQLNKPTAKKVRELEVECRAELGGAV